MSPATPSRVPARPETRAARPAEKAPEATTRPAPALDPKWVETIDAATD